MKTPVTFGCAVVVALLSGCVIQVPANQPAITPTASAPTTYSTFTFYNRRTTKNTCRLDVGNIPFTVEHIAGSPVTDIDTSVEGYRHLSSTDMRYAGCDGVGVMTIGNENLVFGMALTCGRRTCNYQAVGSLVP